MLRTELHLHAIARLLALLVADGDQDKALGLIKDWAYNFKVNPLSRDQMTEDFIQKYLMPDADIDAADIAKFIGRYIETKRELDYEAIHDAIIGMNLADFYTTAYWISIATYIKGEAKKKCQKCGGTNARLKTIYKTRKNRGYELLHLDDLECLCEHCVEEKRAWEKDWKGRVETEDF